MNSAYVSALAALAGSAIGAFASLATTWLTQRFQDRTQRRAQEISRREKLFGDFIDEASKMVADAMMHSLDDPSKLVPLYAIKGRMRLFASDRTTTAADAVMKRIVHTYYTPNADFHKNEPGASETLTFLDDFIEACRSELVGY
jgi:hypothetical protein